MQVIFDIETTRIANWRDPRPDKVHCIGAVVDGNEKLIVNPTAADVEALYSKATTLVGHNIIKFDIPALNNAFGLTPPEHVKVVDTKLESTIRFPDLKELDFRKKLKDRVDSKHIGKHSLEAWGQRLKFPKGDYSKEMEAKGQDPWAEYSQLMGDYCAQDVRVTARLLELLQSRPVPGDVLDLEYFMDAFCWDMTQTGYPFNYEKSQELLATLTNEKYRLLTQLQREVPAFYKPAGEFIPKKDSKIYCAGQPLTKVTLNEFNPNSDDHKKRYLYDRGWSPDLEDQATLTDAGRKALKDGLPVTPNMASAKTENIEDLDIPGVQPLIQYCVVVKRLSQLSGGAKAWLNFLEDDGRIHGSYNTMGCISSRASHVNPNIGQVPKGGKLEDGSFGAGFAAGKGGKPYGNECRDLFEPLPGHVMVGADLSNLEGMVLGHYMIPFGGQEYANLLMAGNNHDRNAEILQCDRGTAKTWYYAMIFGGGMPKLGKILGGGPELGTHSKARFSQEATGFGELSAALTERVKAADIKGLDGRPLHIRKAHAALNLICQSAGAIIAKRWIYIAHHKLEELDLLQYGKFLAWVHDEVQCSVEPEYADAWGKVLVQSAAEAGRQLKVNVPISAEYAKGASWRDTH